MAEEDTFRDITSTLGEHFTDYLVIGRLNNGGMVWRASNTNWAVGAAERYQCFMRDNDYMDVLERQKWD